MFSINLPIVSNFCDCFDLRTSGLIIGWLGALTSCVSIFLSVIFVFLYGIENVYVNGISNVFGLVISACWLYGIYENRPSYMLINVITVAVVTIVLYIGVVFTMVLYLKLAVTSFDRKMLLDISLFIHCILTVGFKNIKDTTSESTGHEVTSPA
ncbi:uncharacterized protein LOC116348767 isoform X2 [Contarinia nasturtii]|uniref:uncharacterized protein LOC116348767 isoform X2 n=1 Tax=Contarinia nasturtii TaxID=265458 RepID=UPI0012D3A628|nr:uncharacterized protein LOC116348767 isoform X2 [Contarinia nasturtii]